MSAEMSFAERAVLKCFECRRHSRACLTAVRKAGITFFYQADSFSEMPAFAGMTVKA